MKSLMRIYFSYIATALAIIVAFVVLQVVLLGIVTSKLYENESGGGKYAIARVYQARTETGWKLWPAYRRWGPPLPCF